LTTPLDQRTIGSDHLSGLVIMVIPARVGWRGLFSELMLPVLRSPGLIVERLPPKAGTARNGCGLMDGGMGGG